MNLTMIQRGVKEGWMVRASPRTEIQVVRFSLVEMQRGILKGSGEVRKVGPISIVESFGDARTSRLRGTATSDVTADDGGVPNWEDRSGSPTRIAPRHHDNTELRHQSLPTYNEGGHTDRGHCTSAQASENTLGCAHSVLVQGPPS